MNTVSIKANIDRTFDRLNDAIEHMALLENFTAPRPSTAERAAAGKALREKVPRKAHAQYGRRNSCRYASPACWRRPSPSCAVRRR
jgi:hypothetical protein